MNGSSPALTPSNLFGSRLTALGLVLVLCACATSPQGRQKITTPAPISDVYSDAEMRLDLATIPGIQTPCIDEECELNRTFDEQVQQQGARIASAAYDAHPDLIKRISHFEFEVAEKKDPGITSNASGKIVILRGTQQIGLNEEALAFVIAREMGHVISQHHDENTTTRIMLSVAAGLLFPALHLFGNTAAIAQATSASTATSTMLATTAASTATSYLSAKLVLNNLKPEQLSEADQVALDLLERMGWSHQDLAQSLENSAEFEPSNAWSEEFRFSAAQVRSLESASDAIEPLPENPLFDINLAQVETEELEPLEAGLIEVAADPLQITVEIADTPVAPLADTSVASVAPAQTMQPSVAATAMKRISQPLQATRGKVMASPAKSVKKPARNTARQKTKTASPKRKTAEDSKMSRAGKGAKSEPAKVSSRSRKVATAKERTPRKSGKPAKKPAA